MIGVDRLYLGAYGTAAAKLAVCVCTCGLGGFVWGLVDFFAIMLNAFHKRDAIARFGMYASFDQDQVHGAFLLAFVDVFMIPASMVLVNFYLRWQAHSRMERLRESAMKHAAPRAGAGGAAAAAP